MKNIELFDQYAATILAELYQSFPVKTRLDARKLSGHTEVNEFGEVLNDQGTPSKEFEVALATITWLADTGYIRGSDVGAAGMSGAVLTAHGLAALKSTPSSIEDRPTIGDTLSRFVREGSFDLAKDALKAALIAGGKTLAGL